MALSASLPHSADLHETLIAYSSERGPFRALVSRRTLRPVRRPGRPLRAFRIHYAALRPSRQHVGCRVGSRVGACRARGGRDGGVCEGSRQSARLFPLPPSRSPSPPFPLPFLDPRHRTLMRTEPAETPPAAPQSAGPSGAFPELSLSPFSGDAVQRPPQATGPRALPRSGAAPAATLRHPSYSEPPGDQPTTRHRQTRGGAALYIHLNLTFTGLYVTGRVTSRPGEAG